MSLERIAGKNTIISIMQLFSIFMICFMINGCAKNKKVTDEEYVIPHEDTVEAQFAVAWQQQQKARGVFAPDLKDRELSKAIQAYELVEQRFPNDPTYTPAAALQIAEIYKDMERYDLASDKYLYALETYPEDSDIRVAGLLGLGESLDEVGQYEEAKVYFKLLIDEYKTTGNPDYRRAVERARSLYRQIR